MHNRLKNAVKNSTIGRYLINNRQRLGKIQESLDIIEGQNREIIFANIFRDSIQSSDWLKDKGFSPYRGAANYSLLYKLYKIYDVYKPEKTLEFGLGQTTKLTSQYLTSNRKAKAIVVDNSQEWIDIYRSQLGEVPNLSLVQLSLRDFKKGTLSQENAEYDKLDGVVKKEKFNLIIIDGPIGHHKEYARTNILGLVDNLAKEWIVIFDDAERSGEQNTITVFIEELKKKGVSFSNFSVSGIKTQRYFCSPDIKQMITSI